ncbi:hypothetical protein [Paractinoplanes lichenicola]|uniref:ABC transporter permease n=1 Tax=Paractinoplanes lichenicola TaxID=2802976 RepID=A0ABS1VJA4_9ACTN|nr:hypothetical protein [Actinoplanes lichenicola]MBL7254786.1 hypothetical protein [Actinoplanes lichenicola]
MRRSPVTLGVLIAIVVVAVQALLVPLFAAPAANIAPRDLPIAVAGPPADAGAAGGAPGPGAIAARLEAEHPGAFAVTTVADAAAADAAIKNREVYGAILVTAAGPEVHVASAASPTVSALLTQAAAGLGPQVPVRDVVPLDANDPRGSGFAGGFLPLAITSLLAGVLIFLLVRRRAARFAALLTYGVLAGLATAVVQQGWLGILPGDYLLVAAALGLFALAVSAAMTGLAALLGRGGLGLGAAVMFLVGNALAGITAAPELLPQPWGEVGQWLPIGAGASLVRSAAYFDGAGAAQAVAVLTAYAGTGLILTLIGRSGLVSKEGPAAQHAEAREELVTAR